NALPLNALRDVRVAIDRLRDRPPHLGAVEGSRRHTKHQPENRQRRCLAELTTKARIAGHYRSLGRLQVDLVEPAAFVLVESGSAVVDDDEVDRRQSWSRSPVVRVRND